MKLLTPPWCTQTITSTLPHFTFIPHPEFATLMLAPLLDSLVRVSRRVDEGHFVKDSRTWGSLCVCVLLIVSRSQPPPRPPHAHHLVHHPSRPDCSTLVSVKSKARALTPPSTSTHPASTTSIDSDRERTGDRNHQHYPPPNTAPHRFPFNNFTHCLTPFPRCFSSFPHGTCSLSVSCLYLAFGEIYHLL